MPWVTALSLAVFACQTQPAVTAPDDASQMSDSAGVGAGGGNSQPSATADPSPAPKRDPAPAPPELDLVTGYMNREVAGLTGVGMDPAQSEWEDAPKACTTLLRQFRKRSDMIEFSCAIAPSGAIWSVVANVPHVPNKTDMQALRGSWYPMVTMGKKRLEGPAQSFECYGTGSCSFGSCGEHSSCPGHTPPGGFLFEDVDGDGTREAFLYAIQEVNSSSVDESSITLWQTTAKGLTLHPLSEHMAIAATQDCDGDGASELLVNPYRVAGDDFTLLFEFFSRISSPAWSVLATRNPKRDASKKGDSGYRFDSPLAIAYAKQLCPAAPRDAFGAHPFTWPAQLHCALLWGAANSHLTQQLERACERPDAKEFCAANRAALQHMTKAQLPLQLSAGTASTPFPAECFANPYE